MIGNDFTFLWSGGYKAENSVGVTGYLIDCQLFNWEGCGS